MNRRKTLSLAFALTLGAHLALAAPVDDALEGFVPSCSQEASTSTEKLDLPLPTGWTSRLIRIASDDLSCAGQQLEIRAGSRIYVGYPWVIAGYGGSAQKRIEAFAWERLQQSVKAEVSANVDERGMRRATAVQLTDWGPVPLEGWVDSNDTVFFPGDFYTLNADIETVRRDRLSPLLEDLPTQGDPEAEVELIEFSDFQCPSCKRAAGFMDDIIRKYGDRLVYRRIDFPLFQGHPWAFPAAVMGRAIHRQSSEAFWTFKKAVYASQSEINTFTIGDFARGIAKDYDLDLARYDADVQSAELRNEIAEGITIATGLQIVGTPTFWVNGRMVSPGVDGAHLDAYIAKAVGDSSNVTR